MGSYLSNTSDEKTEEKSEEKKFSNGLTVGFCKLCKKEQTEPGKGGYWIRMSTSNFSTECPWESYTKNTYVFPWVCHECKLEKEIKSYPVACERCNYDDVRWYQGHTYACPRCISLGITHSS